MMPKTRSFNTLIVLFIFINFVHSVKILGILENFKLCYIHIHPLESNIEIEDFENFDFPILLVSFNYKPKYIGPGGYFEIVDYGHTVYKWTLCSTQLILLSKFETFITQTLLGYRSHITSIQNDYCNQNFAKFPRTNCAIIISGMQYHIWDQYLQNYPNDFIHLSFYEKLSGINKYEYFAVFTGFPNYNGLKIQYICRQCFSINKTIVTEVTFTHSNNLRRTMEKSVQEITANGKNLIFPSTSYLDMTDRKTGSADFITSNGILSFHKFQDSANIILSSISPSSFYLNYKKTFTYIQILQSIIFETLPLNISEMISKEYRELKSKEEVNVRTCTLDVFLYSTMSKKLYYVFDESFNFLTCHGIQSPKNLGIYIDEFHWYLWLLLGIIIGTASVILTLQYATLENFHIQIHTIYVLSFILENSIDYIIPKSKSKLVYRSVVISLSITSIVIGTCYKAVITRDVILPIHNYLIYDKLSELTGFQFFVLPNTFVQSSKDGMESLIEYSTGYGSNVSENGESTPDTPTFVAIASTFFERLQTYFMYSDSKEAMEYFQRTKILPFKEQVFKLLNDCSKKRALIGLENEVNEFISYARTQPNSQLLLKGKDEFLPVNYYWQVPLAAGPYLHGRMSGLITSGIHDYWKNLYYKRNQTEIYESIIENQPLENNVQSNLGSLSKIFGFGIICSGLIFFVEVFIVYIKLLCYIWQKSPLY